MGAERSHSALSASIKRSDWKERERERLVVVGGEREREVGGREGRWLVWWLHVTLPITPCLLFRCKWEQRQWGFMENESENGWEIALVSRVSGLQRCFTTYSFFLPERKIRWSLNCQCVCVCECVSVCVCCSQFKQWTSERQRIFCVHCPHTQAANAITAAGNC